jgi:hypothetical protein
VVTVLLLDWVLGMIFHGGHHAAAAPQIPASVPGATIAGCTVDPQLGIADVEGTARNTTGSLADLTVQAAVFTPAGLQLSTTWGSVAVVVPGHVASFDAPGAEYPLAAGPVVCRMVAVTWTAHTAGPLAPADPGWSPYQTMAQRLQRIP